MGKLSRRHFYVFFFLFLLFFSQKIGIDISCTLSSLIKKNKQVCIKVSSAENNTKQTTNNWRYWSLLFYFSQKEGIGILMQIVSQATICMKCQAYFLRIFFSSERRHWHFMQIVSQETTCMKCQAYFQRKKKKKKTYKNVVCWKYYPACQLYDADHGHWI